MPSHPDTRFTWSDLSFFRKWYLEKVKGSGDEATLRKLIKDGRIELINGGLVQNDEATPRAKDIYMNYEEGL
jgi:hypothetical protein